MAKDISLPNSNLYIKGSGHNTNGNKVIKLSFPNGPSFSIQTNGNLPNTHSLLRGLKTIKQLEVLTKTELKQIEKECISYIKKYGTELQKSKLRVY